MKTMEVETDIRPRKTKTENADLDITPMIDITFLLLAFFIMVSKMDPQASVDLPPAKYGQSVPEKNCVVFIVKQGATPETPNIYRGRAAKDDELITATDPIEREGQVADYVESRLSSAPQIQAILIKAEGDVRTGAVETIKRGIAGSDLGKTRQVYVAVEDEQ
jgi:biopolymer transport protein ExbD